MANELVSSREIDGAFEAVSALIKEARIRVAKQNQFRNRNALLVNRENHFRSFVPW